jgi:hypothetical protein
MLFWVTRTFVLLWIMIFCRMVAGAPATVCPSGVGIAELVLDGIDVEF